MSQSFVHSRRIEFIDTDMAGIVHFANFNRFMEQAEAAFFRSLDLTIAERPHQGTAVGWPRVSVSCSFKSPAFFEDVLDIAIQIQRIGVKSLTMNFTFTRDETLIATGRLKTAYCRFSPKEPIKAIEIPPEIVAKLEPFVADTPKTQLNNDDNN